jgi:hypothetical protein
MILICIIPGVLTSVLDLTDWRTKQRLPPEKTVNPDLKFTAQRFTSDGGAKGETPDPGLIEAYFKRLA